MHKAISLNTSGLWFLCCWMYGTCASSEDWTRFGGPSGDFRIATPVALKAEVGNGWTIPLGCGDAAPVVAANRIFVSEASHNDEGMETLDFSCLSLIDGSMIWKQTLEEQSFPAQDISEAYPVRPLASPVIAGKRIVSVSYGGIVTCMSTDDGTVQWKKNLVTDFHAPPLQFGWSTSPWSDGRTVVIACGSAEATLVALDLESGRVIWTAGSGEAAYGSIASCKGPDGSDRLSFISRDTLLVLDATTGTVIWESPLPSPGLTNAVTPVWLNAETLLIAGQGFKSTKRLRISPGATMTESTEWDSSQLSPFYCNWIVDPKSQSALCYNGNLLRCIDLETGKLRWKERGWIDANLLMLNDQLLAVRGDGVIAMGAITERGIQLSRGARRVNDRVWAPPVVVDDTLIVRGRRSLSVIPLHDLPTMDVMPNGTDVDAMESQWGKRNQEITTLLQTAEKHPDSLTFEQYQSVAEDRSLPWREDDYRKLLNALRGPTTLPMALRIAADWVQRDPESIAAFDAWQSLHDDAATTNLDPRYTKVTFHVTVPDTTSFETQIYIAGNAKSVGNWAPDGILLTRQADGSYQADAYVPTGKLEFKVTQGTWESVEVRTDGRGISNRRRAVRGPTEVNARVQRWKSKETND